MECTTASCGNPTSGTYICHVCVRDLQNAIDYALSYLDELQVNIARQDVGPRPEGGGSGKAGSKPPCNLEAIDLKHNLQTINPNATAYENDPNASMKALLIEQWGKRAATIVEGPPPATPRNPSDLATKLKQEIPGPLHTKPLLQWLHQAHGITIHPARLRQWAHRKLITRTNTQGRPTYDPATVITHIQHNAKSKLVQVTKT